MAFNLRVHFDNSNGFKQPKLLAWSDGSALTAEIADSGQDAFGPFFDMRPARNIVRFKFFDASANPIRWEGDELQRTLWPLAQPGGAAHEVWCRGAHAFVYHSLPKEPSALSASERVGKLQFMEGMYVPGTGGLSGLGANPLKGGGVLFGLYHPNAARVYVAGDFNDWQCPGSRNADPSKFKELDLHRGWFGMPNTWLAEVPSAKPGQEYQFFIEGGVPTRGDGIARAWATDPYARQFGASFSDNDAVIVDPSSFKWTDSTWTTPYMDRLIIYELSVYGFTEGDAGIKLENRGCFSGITERIKQGYFNQLGVTALSLMPLAEFPSPQAPDTMGYNPSTFFTVERDFGTPDDLREMIDAAHAAGLSVMLDQVFNHTDNNFNPLWKLILEHPGEETIREEGGLYFNGSTPWGNRIATEKHDVQNMLIDACKMFLREYHVDGFRFDATNTNYMDHGFLYRLRDEIKGFKADSIMIVENLPNQSDLNFHGYDGYAQWCDNFHDKTKALLREGVFQDVPNSPEGMGDIFYFCKGSFAAHTNNVINYCESHDEESVAHEVGTTPWLNNPAAKERKARLGYFATMAALGQPMIYMGQEFNTDRPRNRVTVEWPDNLGGNGFFQWASSLARLRSRYPGLRISGYNPVEQGQFEWILGPWMDEKHGGGRRVIGWRARPNHSPSDAMVVMLNFEGGDVGVDLELGAPGVWVKLADIDKVNDIPDAGFNPGKDPTALRSNDGRFSGFILPSSSAFVYKWEAAP